MLIRRMMYILAIITGFFLYAIGNGLGEENGLDLLIQRIKSTNSQERAQAAYAIQQDRNTKIYKLICIVTTPNEYEGNEGVVVTAISLLGDMRSIEAIPVLVNNIDYSYTPASIKIPTLETIYPCVGALESIGDKSLVPLLDSIEKNSATTARQKKIYLLTATVIEKILGKRLAAEIIQERIDNQNDAVIKNNLITLQEIVNDGE